MNLHSELRLLRGDLARSLLAADTAARPKWEAAISQAATASSTLAASGSAAAVVAKFRGAGGCLALESIAEYAAAAAEDNAATYDADWPSDADVAAALTPRSRAALAQRYESAAIRSLRAAAKQSAEAVLDHLEEALSELPDVLDDVSEAVRDPLEKLLESDAPTSPISTAAWTVIERIMETLAAAADPAEALDAVRAEFSGVIRPGRVGVEL